jgi:subtilisin family serine protease
MSLKSVKFKDKKSFEKNKNKPNVVQVFEPFGIIVFRDEKPVTPDPAKVSQSNSVEESLDHVESGLAIVMAKNYAEGKSYLEANKIVVNDSFESTKTFFVEVPDFVSFDSFYASVMASGLFVSVEPDYIVPMAEHAEMAYAGHWHLPDMKCQEAWAQIPAGSVKEVAVLDIACETTHEDLQGSISAASWNCVTDAPDVNPISDFENHGTSCSGVIAANTGNDIGCKSIGNNIVKVQFLHIGFGSTSGGGFRTSDTILTRAVNKAIENPNCVAMSMSWGSTGSGYPVFANALTAARTTARNGKGIPLFASSGNGYQSDFTQLPASYPSVMAVGASTQNNTRAGFSNYGPKLFAAAPGTSLYTTDRTGAVGYGPDSYKGFSGTSASCPAMAAVAGLVIAKNPDLTEMQVRDILKNSCRKIGGYAYDANGKSAELGFGIIDANTAVSLAGGTTPPPPQAILNVYGVISSPANVEAGATTNVSYSVMIDKALEGDLLAPIVVSFKNPSGSLLNFYTGVVIVPKGQTSATGTLPYTAPNNVSGVCQFILTIDPSNAINESNENDNIALTSINVAMPTPPTQVLDAEVVTTGFEWLDATRVRIWYKITNKGTGTITSYKGVSGFDGQYQGSWTRNDRIMPGRSVSMGTVWSAQMQGQLPNTWRVRITEVNGLPDSNPANNEGSIVVTR